MPPDSHAPNRRILLVDDNESIHHDFRKILNPSTAGKTGLASAAAELFGGPIEAVAAEEGFDIDSAFQGQEALKMVAQACAEGRPYAMAFVDLRMPPGWDGIETIGHLWKVDSDLQVVICTAYSDYSLSEMVGKLGRSDKMLVLKKPFDSIEARQLADALTEKWRLLRESRMMVRNLEARVADTSRQLHKRQQELADARRLELVGKLAGGIAHDFNSLLTTIIGHAGLIRQESAAGTLAHQSATEIDKSAAAAARLTQQLLAFSRQQMLKIERVDVPAAIRGMTPDLTEILGADVELVIGAAASDGRAMVDAPQLAQVLAGLARNAREAMPRGGLFTIVTADTTLAEGDAARDADTEPGDFLQVTVSDTGPGIAEEIAARVFEPFFTTKAAGESKGLGLSVCHGALKQMGGTIRLESAPGAGAVFKLYLPRKRPGGSGVAVTGIAGMPGNAEAPRSAKGGVIVLAEPNTALRQMAARVLEHHGYTVFPAADSREAVSAAAEAGHVDLLVADSSVQGMTCRELAEALRASSPHLKILYSATTDSPATQDTNPEAKFIQKPYAPTILVKQVQEILAPTHPA